MRVRFSHATLETSTANRDVSLLLHLLVFMVPNATLGCVYVCVCDSQCLRRVINGIAFLALPMWIQSRISVGIIFFFCLICSCSTIR